jgi:hypothetical protein
MEATASVSVEQAAAILGVSASTIHRRIRSGALRAERAERPQGAVWLVHLPAAVAGAAGQTPPPTTVEATAPTAAPVSTPMADAMVSLIQTTIGTVRGPLVAELAASRQTIERQAETIAEISTDRGRLTERLDHVTAELAAVQAQNATLLVPTVAEPSPPSPGPPEPHPAPWWRRWWPIFATVALVWAVVGTLVLLAVR